MANPFAGGGKVQFIPSRVKSPLEEVKQTDADAIRMMGVQRDLIAADLLEGDKYLDMLDAVIDDQMKDLQLPAGEISDAARRLCGSDTIDWDCYKKAKALLELAPAIAHGYDPVQLVFNGKIRKKVGPVIFNCKSFDPDKFFDSTTDDPATVTGADGTDPTLGEFEEPGAVQQRARENQKKWGMLVFFWELLWGKPNVKASYLEQLKQNQSNLEAIQTRIDELNSQKKTEEAKALSSQIAFAKLPDLIREERPAKVEHLTWEPAKTSDAPVENAKDNPTAVAAIKFDPWSMVSGDIKYYDRALPSNKQGFILPLLVGALGLVPKIVAKVLRIRDKLTKKLKKIKKVPVVGRGLYKAWAVCTGIIFLPAAFISNIFIDLCIWLAMKPAGYLIDVGAVPPEYADDMGDLSVEVDEKVSTTMDVEDTPAGFIPMECLAAAQEIVNKVNTDAVQ